MGLNTDICQLAARVFARTGRLDVGSAIMNIICNGGPLAAAERVATALSWHGLDPSERRLLRVGFAAGRFDYINRLGGIVPRTDWERAHWSRVRNAIMWEASEVFVRLLYGEALSGEDIPQRRVDDVVVPRRWPFEITRIVPREFRRELLRLYVGSHDPALQVHLNRFAPVRVLNLSITAPDVLAATHERMRSAYRSGWRRDHLPRTTFVFLDARPGVGRAERRAAARERAAHALGAYWTAVEGTLDPARVARAADNALIGDADDVAAQVAERFDRDDRLMLWFDFFDHDNDRVIDGMAGFATEVLPRLARLGVPVTAPPPVRAAGSGPAGPSRWVRAADPRR